MALKSLNSVGGLSVGWQASSVILSNADVNPNNLTVTATATLGNISNVRIFGGSDGQVLRTDGAGNLSWISGAAGSPGGSNTQIQFNDAGAFNGVSNFTYNKTTNLLNVNGNVVVGDNTNNVSLFSSGAISSTGNLTAANINTGGVLSVTGNANVGNIGATNGVFTNISGTLTTASQPNITAVGTLTSLSVSGNANVGNLGATNGVFTNISGNGSALTNLPAGNISGQVANALVAGTVYTNAQPNITSVGTLTSLSVTGNANTGNLNATNGYFANDAIVNGNLLVNGNLTYLNVETVSVEDPIIELQSGPNGAAPTSNSGKDVGTALNYYDTAAKIAFMGWDVSNAEIAFGSNVAISNEVVTFNQLANTRSGNTLTTGVFATTLSATGNVTGNYFIGNGAILTNLTGANVIGNVANATYATTAGTANSATTSGTVTTAAQPNITSVGTLTALSVSGNANIGNLGVTGVFATTLSATGNANVGNIGATNGVFTNISGNGSGLTGVTAITAQTVTNASQPNITSVGTLTSLSVTGNINAANITGNHFGDGAGLTNLPAANISGQVANALVAGTVYTNAQPNITSVGTLTALSVSGNANIGNLGVTGVFATTLSATGNANVGNLGVTGVFATTLSATGNANVGNIGVSGLVTVIGNVTAANFIGTFIGNATGIANGNSNISIPTAGGNILFATNGTANRMVISTTGNVGIGTNNPAYELEVVGTLAATSKSFLISHPTKQGWKLQYGSLESPYHGVRLTGEAAVVNGYCLVDLPDYIHGLVKQEGAQVQLTTIKHGKVLWVEEINVDKNYFIVKSNKYKKYQDQELKFYWSFTAIRKDIGDLAVELSID